MVSEFDFPIYSMYDILWTCVRFESLMGLQMFPLELTVWVSELVRRCLRNGR